MDGASTLSEATNASARASTPAPPASGVSVLFTVVLHLYYLGECLDYTSAAFVLLG